ncbi:Adenylate kinase 1, chloroplastic [Linum perenne]
MPDLARSPSQNHSFPLRQDPKDRNVQWVFLGCPGVGKGTHASRLSNLLGVPHIATRWVQKPKAKTLNPITAAAKLAIPALAPTSTTNPPSLFFPSRSSCSVTEISGLPEQLPFHQPDNVLVRLIGKGSEIGQRVKERVLNILH